MDFRAPPIKSIADLLLYLLQERKLQAGTIDGNRSAIADKLGNLSINVIVTKLDVIFWSEVFKENILA